MKFYLRSILFALLIFTCTLALPSPVYAQTPNDDKLIIGTSYQLDNGQTLNGDLMIVGGSAILKENSKVIGNIFFTGGSLDVYGEVDGNITGMGGAIFLADTAVIHGDITTLGASLRRSDKAVVEGDFSFQAPGDVRIPEIPRIELPRAIAPAFHLDFKPIFNFLWAILQSLALAALAVLLTLFLEKPTNRVAQSIVSQPVTAGGLGLLTAIVAPALLITLAITILLIPLSLLGILVLGIAVLYGWIAIGLEIGKRIAELLRQEWALPVSAGIGTLLLNLVAASVTQIPCVGWLAPFTISMLGLGGVIISRFGMQVYNPAAATALAAPGASQLKPAPETESESGTPTQGDQQE